jgi:uncharacterized Fe-S cluster-containing radical SAM superfamily protein
MRHTFVDIDINEVRNLSMYSAYKVSGGEPTLDMPRLIRIVNMIKIDRPVYLYTNGARLLDHKAIIASLFNGINLGIHLGNMKFWADKDNFKKLGFINTRIHICEDNLCRYATRIKGMAEFYGVPMKLWKMNDCNPIEHRFLIRG